MSVFIVSFSYALFHSVMLFLQVVTYASVILKLYSKNIYKKIFKFKLKLYRFQLIHIFDVIMTLS